MKTLVNKYNFLLSTNDFDYKDNLRPIAILNYFQTVSGMHASEIGCGYEEFKKRDFAWILVKIKYKVYSQAKLDSEIVVKTWPKEPRRVEHDRCYNIFDKDNNLLVEGLSRWCVIDINTRRISREKDFYEGVFLEEETNLIFDNEIIKNNDFSSMEYVYDYKISLSDLDHNGHMNNTKYGDIILNISKKDKFIKEFEINYINESFINQSLEIYKLDLENGDLFVMALNKETKQIAFKALIKY